MRKMLVAGNWKMNLDWNEAMTLIASLSEKEERSDWSNVEVSIFPPYPYLRPGYEFLKNANSRMTIGAQDCAFIRAGARTGEVSATMLKSIGMQSVIIGHSERRQFHNETSDVLTAKIRQVLDAGLTPIFCCGEQLEDRENDNQSFVISSQLESTIFNLSEEDFENLVIAYEPVWAIGTGKTATPDQAQEMHQFIRGLVQSKYGAHIAKSTHILYGGSVKPENASELFSQSDVDGGLIGGASINADDFEAIIKAAAAKDKD